MRRDAVRNLLFCCIPRSLLSDPENAMDARPMIVFLNWLEETDNHLVVFVRIAHVRFNEMKNIYSGVPTVLRKPRSPMWVLCLTFL